jgi:hypothetical protein
VAQLATEIMNISCVKSVGGPPKLFTRLDMLWRLAGNCSKNAMFCPCKTWEAGANLFNTILISKIEQ